MEMIFGTSVFSEFNNPTLAVGLISFFLSFFLSKSIFKYLILIALKKKKTRFSHSLKKDWFQKIDWSKSMILFQNVYQSIVCLNGSYSLKKILNYHRKAKDRPTASELLQHSLFNQDAGSFFILSFVCFLFNW